MTQSIYKRLIIFCDWKSLRHVTHHKAYLKILYPVGLTGFGREQHAE